tara:strand:+ start:71 stop:406 length:336 start_codon:yes stop_codon:yes gene_type:complete
MSRYDGRKIFRTANPIYSKMLKERDLRYFRFYETPRFSDFDEDDLFDIEDVGHTWSMGDRYYKLAYKYYGNAEMWWVIAWYNEAPTEAHLEIGDVINIPTPLWKVRSVLGV